MLSGINTAANGWVDSSYKRVSSGQISTQFSEVTNITSSQIWTRPSNVHFIDIFLVGGGGSGGGGTTGGDGGGGSTSRGGGGGGGGAVIQFNRFYVGDYDSWYAIVASTSSRAEINATNCNFDQWGHCGNPTIFSPTAGGTSFNMANLVGVDSSNLRRTLIAPGGGGGGHPCGSPGPQGLAGGGGPGTNAGSGMWGISGSDGRITYQSFGGRGGVAGGPTGNGGGGGGAGNRSSNNNGGAGKALLSPFTGTYGGGGAGGQSGSGANGGGNANGGSGVANSGGGGAGHDGSNTRGGYGASGRIGIRMWFSS